MRKNEPDPLKRIAVPIPFFDRNGQLAVGFTFATADGEVFVYRSSTNDWVPAANDAVELGGSGQFSYQFEQAETNYDVILGVKLVKVDQDDQFFWIPIDNSLAALQADIDLLLGLHRRNSLLDGGAGHAAVQYDSDGVMTVGRLRVFADAAALAAATAGAANDDDGEIARYAIAGVASANKLAAMRMAVELEP